MRSGCVCCTLRGDLADELRDLLSRRERGEIPSFERVVVETTGLADPAPIVYTLLSEPVVRHHYALDSIVATVDAVHGLRLEESVKQAAVADTLVVTKVDLADPGLLEERLWRLNPGAEIVEAAFGDVEPDRLFGRPERDPRDLSFEEPPALGTPALGTVPGTEVSRDCHETRAVSFVFDEEIDWTAFGVWLTMLLQAHGADLFRVKGLLNVGGPGPLLLNAVQHVVHPPEHLEAWLDEDRRSRLVVIGRGVDERALQASLRAFNRIARSSE
jgi:G3E family GTPase